MSRKTVNPTQLFDSTQYGFSQIAISAPGKMVYISGQVAWDKDGHLVGKGDLEMQTRKSIQNLKVAIESVGGTLDDILMLRIYVVDLQSKSSEVISKALIESFGTTPPASTWLDVVGLADPNFLIEIEAQAIVPN